MPKVMNAWRILLGACMVSSPASLLKRKTIIPKAKIIPISNIESYNIAIILRIRFAGFSNLLFSLFIYKTYLLAINTIFIKYILHEKLLASMVIILSNDFLDQSL